jgi:hypothetical protein
MPDKNIKQRQTIRHTLAAAANKFKIKICAIKLLLHLPEASFNRLAEY